MKTFLLILVCAGLGACEVEACPVYYYGKMFIVDENGRPVKATVWRYFSLVDSANMSKKSFDIMDADSNAYEFWSSGGWKFRKIDKPADKYLRIHADGYADVIIKQRIEFDSDDDLDRALYIQMYPAKYVNKGALITLLNEFTVEHQVKVKDTLTLTYSDYIQAIRGESTVATANRNAAFIVKTYPNPVIDQLHIEIKGVISKPYKAVVLDMQGKTISETEIKENDSEINMEWEAAGMYMIQVFDPEGKLLYALKFIRS